MFCGVEILLIGETGPVLAFWRRFEDCRYLVVLNIIDDLLSKKDDVTRGSKWNANLKI